MPIKHFPLLLITEQSIEFINNKEALSDALFYYSDEQKNQLKYLQSDGGAYLLESKQPTEFNINALTALLQQQLQLDGHCCIAKLSFSSLQELFLFAEQVYSDSQA